MSGTWRVMMRLARRDLAKNPGRATLTMSSVALPVLVLATMATLLASLSISDLEAAPAQMGQGAATAKVASAIDTSGDKFGIKQRDNNAENVSESGLSGKLWNGKRPTDAESIGAVARGTAHPVTIASSRAVVGERRIRSLVLGVDLRKPVYAGTATLTSGRLPAAPDEVLVTRAGAAVGIPEKGSFTLHVEGAPDRIMKVVGTATTPEAQDLVALPQTSAPGFVVERYLIDRTQPVTWDEVQRLNEYGLQVQSRYLLEHPELAPSDSAGVDRQMEAVIMLLLTGVVLLTALIAGPAFTTSGARQRRVLGQLASNGATHSMLRRYVIAQALLLGVFASALAVALGAAAGLAIAYVGMRVAPQHTYGPLEVPWMQLFGLLVIGAVSALIAALVPAVSAARVDVLSALRGQVSRHRARAGWPIVGLLASIAGGLLLWNTITGPLAGGEVKVALGGGLLFGGAVMALPWLLAQIARAAGALPIAGRMATRDIGRQRSRASSGVAAVMAATALMTALAVAGTSDLAQARRDYIPQAPVGEGMGSGSPTQLAKFATAVRGLEPSLRVSSVNSVTEARDWPTPEAPPSTIPQTELVALPAQCPVPTSVPPQQPKAGCEVLGGQLLGSGNSISVIDPVDAARILGLSGADQTWLAAGNALALQQPSFGYPQGYAGTAAQQTKVIPESVEKSGQLKLAWDKISPTLQGPGRTLAHSTTVKVRVIDGTTSLRAFFGSVIILPTSMATEHQWPLSIIQLRFSKPGGLSKDAEQRISDRAPDAIGFDVERGYSDRSIAVIRIMIASFALIVLIVTLIGTALAQAESRADQATLASIGAPRSIRRRIAGGYALVIGFVGSAIGFVVGLVPGIAATWPLTMERWNPLAAKRPLINIPWELLAPALIGVPVVAALAAMLVTRSNPSITRRQAG
ncbi:ABC transporter permease [Yimella sp. cx-573]|nr:ABC transporter permease [Yimella sp. cx-573]